MRTLLSALLIIAAQVWWIGSAIAQSESSDMLNVLFDEVEKIIIDQYYKEHEEEEDSDEGKQGGKKKGKKKKGKSKELPPGLAKKEELPPGLAKQLERNGTLPPGLAKRDLPENLEARLPETEPGYERVIVGNDVVLIEKATNVVKDIIKDVLQN